jgi:hypothetical protein
MKDDGSFDGNRNEIVAATMYRRIVLGDTTRHLAEGDLI